MSFFISYSPPWNFAKSGSCLDCEFDPGTLSWAMKIEQHPGKTLWLVTKPEPLSI